MTAPMKAGAPRAIASRRGTVPVPKNPKDNTSQHTAMVDRIWLGLGREPGLVLWPNPVKFLRCIDARTGNVFHVRTGLALGSADLIGCLSVLVLLNGHELTLGRFIGIEVKTGSGVARENQETWHALVHARGGFAAIAHDLDEARAAIQRAREGLFQ